AQMTSGDLAGALSTISKVPNDSAKDPLRLDLILWCSSSSRRYRNGDDDPDDDDLQLSKLRTTFNANERKHEEWANTYNIGISRMAAMAVASDSHLVLSPISVLVAGQISGWTESLNNLQTLINRNAELAKRVETLATAKRRKARVRTQDCIEHAKT